MREWILVAFLFCSVGLKAQYQFTISPQEVISSSRNIFKITIINTQDTIPVGTEMKLMTPGVFTPIFYPVFSNITASTNGSGSIIVTDSKTALAEKPPIWPDDNHPIVISYEVVNNPIVTGEIITLELGTLLSQPKVSPSAGPDFFKVAVVQDEDNWDEIGVIEFKIKPRAMREVELYIPSVVKNGEPVLLKMVALDVINNRVDFFTGSYQLVVSDPTATYSPTAEFTSSDSGYIEIPITLNTNGFFNIEAIFYDENNVEVDRYKSNYAWVQDNPDYYIYWGDIHSHSHMSRDGIGFNPFEYARYAACLDYYAASEHVDGFGIEEYGADSMEWEYIKSKVKEHHVPESFVTILSYETTYDAEEGGNHIAYFNVLDSDIDDVERVAKDIAPDIWSFWEYLDTLPSNIEALSWAHFTDTDIFENPNDPFLIVGEDYISPYRPLYEMYSSHGQSEYYDPNHALTENDMAFWFVQDALAEGEKVGFIALSDNHNAKPGQRGNGIGAAISNQLERNALFETFSDRLTYGSTGDRIIMEFKLNGNMMGSEVDIFENEDPTFELMAHGTDDIEFVEMVKWDFFNPIYGNDVHPDFTTVKRWDINSISINTSFTDTSFSSNSVYYLRLKQVNENNGVESWAWSSPIWVNAVTPVNVQQNNLPFESVLLYPNLFSYAASSFINIKVQAIQNVAIQLKVYDMIGREVSQQSTQLIKGENNFELPLNNLSSGRYFVTIEDKADKKMHVKSFIVQ